MSATTTDPRAAATRSTAGKYLTFALGKESYGLQILKVREIIRLTDITRVPRMPTYLRGVINLRGKVVPVADLRVKFGLAEVENRERTCIVVVEISGTAKSLMGLVVDAVEEVVSLAPGDVEPTPDFGVAIDTSYILGIAKVRGTVKTLLDIDRVIGAEALQRIQQAA
jgi:purine-binding chemotaxis protein CheW